jgi:hypothetical protein
MLCDSVNAIAIVDTLSTIAGGAEDPSTEQGERTTKEGQMDRRMLAIGTATVALWAIGCGDSNDDPTPAAAQGPDVEQEYAPDSGTIGEPVVSINGTDRTDAAQSPGVNTHAVRGVPQQSRSDAAQIQRTDVP